MDNLDKSCIQSFQPITWIFRWGNQHWGYTSIYRPLTYPLKSLNLAQIPPPSPPTGGAIAACVGDYFSSPPLPLYPRYFAYPIHITGLKGIGKWKINYSLLNICAFIISTLEYRHNVIKVMTGENSRQFSLLTWTSYIGQFVHSVGEGIR